MKKCLASMFAVCVLLASVALASADGRVEIINNSNRTLSYFLFNGTARDYAYEWDEDIGPLQPGQSSSVIVPEGQFTVDTMGEDIYGTLHIVRTDTYILTSKGYRITTTSSGQDDTTPGIIWKK